MGIFQYDRHVGELGEWRLPCYIGSMMKSGQQNAERKITSCYRSFDLTVVWIKPWLAWNLPRSHNELIPYCTSRGVSFEDVAHWVIWYVFEIDRAAGFWFNTTLGQRISKMLLPTPLLVLVGNNQSTECIRRDRTLNTLTDCPGQWLQGHFPKWLVSLTH